MRYALISDIHANLPALEAVLADIESRPVDATCHLGDLVGYGYLLTGGSVADRVGSWKSVDRPDALPN